MACGGTAGNLRRRWRPGDFTRLDDSEAANGLVVEVDVDLTVLGLAQILGEPQQIIAIQCRGLLGEPAREVRVADDGDAVAHHAFARHGQLAVAALLAGHIDDHAAGLHGLDHVRSDEPRCRLARDQRRGDDDVGFFRLARIHLALRLLEALAHDLGVTATARAFFLVVDLDELPAQRHHLIGHFGTGVVGAHHGTQIGGSADGGQARDTGTGDEDLCRRDLAGGGHLAVEETAEGIGSLNDGAITTDARHGGQRVHLLRTAQLARQRVHCQHGNLALGQLLHELGVLRRPDETDQRGTGLDQADFFCERGPDLEDDIRGRPQALLHCRDLRTGCTIAFVVKVCGSACSGFDGDGKTELDQLFDDFRDAGDTLFARK